MNGMRADHMAIVETLLAASAYVELEYQREVDELRCGVSGNGNGFEKHIG